MHWLADPQAWIAFLTLVLGVDNAIFISIFLGKLQTCTTGIILGSCSRFMI